MSELCSLLNLHPQVIREWFYDRSEQLKLSQAAKQGDHGQKNDGLSQQSRSEVQGALSAKPRRVTKVLRTEMKKLRNRRKH